MFGCSMYCAYIVVVYSLTMELVVKTTLAVVQNYVRCLCGTVSRLFGRSRPLRCIVAKKKGDHDNQFLLETHRDRWHTLYSF